jgi:hypothetical protein
MSPAERIPPSEQVPVQKTARRSQLAGGIHFERYAETVGAAIRRSIEVAEDAMITTVVGALPRNPEPELVSRRQ